MEKIVLQEKAYRPMLIECVLELQIDSEEDIA